MGRGRFDGRHDLGLAIGQSNVFKFDSIDSYISVTLRGYPMNKLEKYSSFDELKESSAIGTVSAAVLRGRQKKMENFIQFLRDSDRTGLSPSESKIGQSR